MSSLHIDRAGKRLLTDLNGNSQAHHPLHLQSAMRSAYFYVPPHNVLTMARSALLPTSVFEYWETNTASGRRLVSTMLGKTNFLSRSSLSSQSCLLSTIIPTCRSYVSCWFTLSHKLSLFALCLIVISLYSPAFQPTLTGLCYVAIYISPGSEQLGVLIECAPWPLSLKTAYSLGYCLVPTVASLQEMGVSYIDLSGNEILNWSFLPNSVQVNSRSGKFHFRPPVYQVLMLLLSVDLPVCSLLQPEQ